MVVGWLMNLSLNLCELGIWNEFKVYNFLWPSCRRSRNRSWFRSRTHRWMLLKVNIWQNKILLEKNLFLWVLFYCYSISEAFCLSPLYLGLLWEQYEWLWLIRRVVVWRVCHIKCSGIIFVWQKCCQFWMLHWVLKQTEKKIKEEKRPYLDFLFGAV